MKTVFSSLLAIAAGFGVSMLMPQNFPASRKPLSEAQTSKARPGSSAAAPTESAMENKQGPGGSDWKKAVEEWAAADPAGLCDWLLKRGAPPDSGVLDTLFTHWAKKDPEAGFKAALDLPEDFDRGAALRFALAPVLDQPGGLAVMLKWSSAVEEQVEGWTLFPDGAWLSSATPGEIAARLETGTGDRMSYFGSMVGIFAGFWAKTDLPAALNWARSLPPGAPRSEAFSDIIRSWTAQDSPGALNYLAAQAGTAERDFTYKPLGELAKTDPRAAMDWVENHLGTAGKSELRNIFTPWCQSDGPAAQEYALSISDPALRRSCLEAWSGQVKPEEVLGLVRQMPEGPDQLVPVKTLAAFLASHEAKTGLRGEGGNISPVLTPEAAVLISGLYARREPAAAFEWLPRIPEEFQAGCLARVFESWPDTAAARAVDQLPDCPFKTAAQKALRDKLSGRKP